MKAVWLTIAAFTLGVARSQDADLSCQNGGACTQKNGSRCLLCSCATGFVGDSCSEVLMKVVGSIQYKRSLPKDTNSSRPLFNEDAQLKERLKNIFDGYQNSFLEKYNSHDFISGIKFIVYTKRPTDVENFNATQFRMNHEERLQENATTDAVFSNSTGKSVRSVSVDVDECASGLNVCAENEECYNTETGYKCPCVRGFSRENSTKCAGKYCLLSLAPTWPSSATRIITYPNGITSSDARDQVLARTVIQYKCPDRYTLVNSATGKAETKVIECIGSKQPTNANTGWQGNDVRCDMTVEFMIAIIAAAVSCVIIVLVGGAMIVSHAKKKKTSEDDTEVLEMS